MCEIDKKAGDSTWYLSLIGSIQVKHHFFVQTAIKILQIYSRPAYHFILVTFTFVVLAPICIQLTISKDKTHAQRNTKVVYEASHVNQSTIFSSLCRMRKQPSAPQNMLSSEKNFKRKITRTMNKNDNMQSHSSLICC